MVALTEEEYKEGFFNGAGGTATTSNLRSFAAGERLLAGRRTTSFRLYA